MQIFLMGVLPEALYVVLDIADFSSNLKLIVLYLRDFKLVSDNLWILG